MDKKNTRYLIGNAELLTNLKPPPKVRITSNPLYSADELYQRLHPQLVSSSSELAAKDEDTCPNDFSVLKVTLHPSFISKSAFPSRLFKSMNARPIGSKAESVRPDKWKRVGEPFSSPSTSIFIATKRDSFYEFASEFGRTVHNESFRNEIEKIWQIEEYESKQKIKNIDADTKTYEVVLQQIPNANNQFIMRAFIRFATKLELTVFEDLIVQVSSLCFIPVRGAREQVERIADFSFVRVLRAAPQLRAFPSPSRSTGLSMPVLLKKQGPLNPNIKVAVLDGGLPVDSVIAPWINEYKESDPKSAPCAGAEHHGLHVSSALLFGPLTSPLPAPRPFSYIDNYRIIDQRSQGDDLDLYRCLQDIEDILLSRQYEFINLSVGPCALVQDDEVHAWTSVIDGYLSEGDVLMTVAAGNNGASNAMLGLNRVQVPSDLVNALAVGAASTTCKSWERADYSAVGPGRYPGRVKPDLLAFGGSQKEYFHVLDNTKTPNAIPQRGTSFAAHYLLRKAIGLRANFGDALTPLAIKALLVHSANDGGFNRSDVGWGKVPDNIDVLVESQPGSAKIIYQDILKPGKYLNVPVPIPKSGVNGMVTIKATCCITTPIDPQDTSMYTKAGVDITWRPNTVKTDKKTQSFFKQNMPATEAELRRDAGKWETILTEQISKRGSSLKEPAFELHYIARDSGANISGVAAPDIKYAFIVELIAPKHPELFNDILNSHSALLAEISPEIKVEATLKS